MRRASADPRADVGHGVGTDDTPAFAGMHESAARVFQGSVDLARAIAAQPNVLVLDDPLSALDVRTEEAVT